MDHHLSNPVWQALSSRQKQFNIGTNTVKFYPADIAPFVGLKNWDEHDMQDMMKNLPSSRSYSVMIAKNISLPDNVKVVFTAPLYQMYCSAFKPYLLESQHVRTLTQEDVPLMISLTDKAKPGPFFKRTIEMGKYIGLFDGEKLVAMAGERLKVPGHTEISAICTDPDYNGKGYASFLSTLICQHVIAEGNIPILHVKSENTRAIEVYRKLGFEISADVFFAIFRLPNS
jgi:predicted GNAT family acetyltransferase